MSIGLGLYGGGIEFDTGRAPAELAATCGEGEGPKLDEPLEPESLDGGAEEAPIGPGGPTAPCTDEASFIF